MQGLYNIVGTSCVILYFCSVLKPAEYYEIQRTKI